MRRLKRNVHTFNDLMRAAFVLQPISCWRSDAGWFSRP